MLNNKQADWPPEVVVEAPSVLDVEEWLRHKLFQSRESYAGGNKAEFWSPGAGKQLTCESWRYSSGVQMSGVQKPVLHWFVFKVAGYMFLDLGDMFVPDVDCVFKIQARIRNHVPWPEEDWGISFRSLPKVRNRLFREGHGFAPLYHVDIYAENNL